MLHCRFPMFVIFILSLTMKQIYSITPYDLPDITIRRSNISEIQIYNQNTYFILQKTSNSTVFQPYYNSFLQNYYTYLGNGSMTNLCISKSKQLLFMVYDDQATIQLLKWSIPKKEFIESTLLQSQVLELLSLKINQSNFYLVIAYRNGTIGIFVEKNNELIYKSNFQFHFFSQNFKMDVTKDGETICVIYAYEETLNATYQIYFFTINQQGIFRFIASNNFSSPDLTSSNTEPKISMTWFNFSATELTEKSIVFTTQNHKQTYFKAYLEQIGSQNDYVLQITQLKNNFGSVFGIVPALSYEQDSYDIFADSSISTINSNEVISLIQNNTLRYIMLSSTFNYIIVGYTSHVDVYFYVVPKQLDFFGILMEYLTGSYAQLVLSSILSTPSGRQALNYFQSLFFNIDDFWLFMYHERKYGYTLRSIFDCARIAENDKWKIYGVNQQLTLLQDLQQQLHNYYNYDFWTHKTFLALEDRSQALLSNTIEFFLLNLPFSIVVFGIFRIIYCLTSRWKIGKFFKRYSFSGYLLIIISEGNLQYFSYLCTNQLRMLFFFNIVNKLVIVFTIICFFFVIFACIGLFMLLKYFYGRKICDILECEKGNQIFIFWVTYQFGIRNVALGFAHAILNDSYYYQMGAIFFVDSLSIIFIYVLFMHSKTYFAGNWQFLMKMINYCIRMLLYVSLVAQYSMKVQQGDLQDKLALQLIEMFDFIQQKIVLMIMLSWIISFIVEIIPQRIVRPKKEIDKKKKRKQSKAQSIIHSMKLSVKAGQQNQENPIDNAKSLSTTIPDLNKEFKITNLDDIEKNNIQPKIQSKIKMQPKLQSKINFRETSKPKTKKQLKSTKFLMSKTRKLQDLTLSKHLKKQPQQQICQVIKINQLKDKLDNLMF